MPQQNNPQTTPSENAQDKTTKLSERPTDFQVKDKAQELTANAKAHSDLLKRVKDVSPEGKQENSVTVEQKRKLALAANIAPLDPEEKKPQIGGEQTRSARVTHDHIKNAYHDYFEDQKGYNPDLSLSDKQRALFNRYGTGENEDIKDATEWVLGKRWDEWGYDDVKYLAEQSHDVQFLRDLQSEYPSGPAHDRTKQEFSNQIYYLEQDLKDQALKTKTTQPSGFRKTLNKMLDNMRAVTPDVPQDKLPKGVTQEQFKDMQNLTNLADVITKPLKDKS